MNETEFEAPTLQLLKARGVDENRLWRYQAALGEKEASISFHATTPRRWE
jgi:hypothetical protein